MGNFELRNLVCCKGSIRIHSVAFPTPQITSLSPQNQLNLCIKGGKQKWDLTDLMFVFFLLNLHSTQLSFICHLLELADISGGSDSAGSFFSHFLDDPADRKWSVGLVSPRSGLSFFTNRTWVTIILSKL